MKRPAELLAPKPRGAVELTRERTLNSKTFELPNGRRRTVATTVPIHYDSKGGLPREVVLEPRQRNGRLVVDQAGFKLNELPGQIGVTYQSRVDGVVTTMTLESVNGQRVPRIAPIADDNSIVWRDVLPGFDVFLLIRPTGVEWFKKINHGRSDDTKTVELVWRVEGPTGAMRRTFNPDFPIIGRDADGDRARVEKEILEVNRAGGRIKETIWRQASKVTDRASRRRRWSRDVAYPMLIDVPDISEQITGDLFDGHIAVEERANLVHGFSLPVSDGMVTSSPVSWNTGIGLAGWEMSVRDFVSHYSSSGGSLVFEENKMERAEYGAGFFFPNILCPATTTILNATLKLHVYGNSGNTDPALRVYASDVGHAGRFTASDNPLDMANKIPGGGVAWTPDAATDGWHSIDVTSAVQTIVDRDDWVTGGGMRFGALPQASEEPAWPATWTTSGTGTSTSYGSTYWFSDKRAHEFNLVNIGDSGFIEPEDAATLEIDYRGGEDNRDTIEVEIMADEPILYLRFNEQGS